MPETKKRKKSKYRCAMCNRRLPQERWVYSQHTGNRYCWPGEGCHKSRSDRA